MASLGNRLRQVRLERGVPLSEIAAETRISVRYLEALENEDLKILPGAIFARSFARQYARFVGIDEAEIEDEVQSLFHNEGEKVEPGPLGNGTIHVEPLPEMTTRGNSSMARLWPIAGLAAAVVATTGLYMGWQRFQQYRMEPVSLDQPEPHAAAAAAAAVAAKSIQVAEEPPVQPLPAAAANEVPVPQAAGHGMAVRLVASEKTWVSISANGKNVFSGILQANEVRNLSGVERARMIVGNAGGLQVLTDGKSIGPIGPPGQVRIVLLTPEGPQILRRQESVQSTESSETGGF
jgi:cytoskeleton protein RodZ